MARLLLERGIGVEAGLATVADAHTFAASGPRDSCLRVLVAVEEEEPERAVAAAAAVDDELLGLALRPPQLHHGVGIATWAVMEAAIARGRDIRVGLEDTLVLADSRPAGGNADLVAAAVRLAARAPESRR